MYILEPLSSIHIIRFHPFQLAPEIPSWPSASGCQRCPLSGAPLNGASQESSAHLIGPIWEEGVPVATYKRHTHIYTYK